MLLGRMFEQFCKGSPVAVMIRGTLEYALNAQEVDALFERCAQTQYTRELLFSTTVDLMSQTVCGVQKSVHAAYQKSPEDISVSITAVYDKLQGIEPPVAAALVRHTAARLGAVITQMKGQRRSLLPGYRAKILDGNCLEASEHRIFELRTMAAGPLPGKALVTLDPQAMLAIDVFPCEDGHAQERSLLDDVLATVEANDLWIADRNFCTLRFLLGIARQLGYFVIRHHAQLPYETLGPWREIGASATGYLRERTVRLTDEAGNTLECRLVRVQLFTPTRDGEDALQLLTNLPAKVAAATVAEIYQKRWTIETAFQHLTVALRCEINTLGYPKAALFGFCVALCCYNVLAVTQAALRAKLGEQWVEEELSTYYLADEIAGMYRGMMVALPPARWKCFRRMDAAQMAATLLELVDHIRLSAFQKHRRGPKKPSPKRVYDPKHPHVSTKKLLTARKKKKLAP